jgi:hypothetical protein
VTYQNGVLNDTRDAAYYAILTDVLSQITAAFPAAGDAGAGGDGGLHPDAVTNLGTDPNGPSPTCVNALVGCGLATVTAVGGAIICVASGGTAVPACWGSIVASGVSIACSTYVGLVVCAKCDANACNATCNQKQQMCPALTASRCKYYAGGWCQCGAPILGGPGLCWFDASNLGPVCLGCGVQ